MVISLLSGLPPRPRGKRWLRSAWRNHFLEKRRRHLLRTRRKRDLANFAKSLHKRDLANFAKCLHKRDVSDFAKPLRKRDVSDFAKPLHKQNLTDFAKTLRSDRGSVESALVVIPLMTLFLISFQLVLTISSRNIEASYAQSSATHNSITSRFEQGDAVIDLNSPDAFNKLRAVVTTRNRVLPNLVPHLGSQDHAVKVHGFSILEDQG